MYEAVDLISVAATEIPDSDLLWCSDASTQTAGGKQGILEQLGRRLIQDKFSPDDCITIANYAIQALKAGQDRKSTRLNSSHVSISYAVFCLTPHPSRSTPFPYTTLFRSFGSGYRNSRQ